MDFTTLFLIVLPIVAFLYASVGHGGASGYLALMALFGFAPETMKPTALLLNLFVAGIAFIQYYRKGHFNARLFAFFAIGSIPLAFIGGGMEINVTLYKGILGVLLLFAVGKMLGIIGGQEKEEIKKVSALAGIGIGMAIGFFSGLIGIGGGIILSPVILLFGWGKMKEAAAVSALFIWVNSAAGFTGQYFAGLELHPSAFLWVGIAVVGGFLGSYFGSTKYSHVQLKRLLAVVLILASIKLFIV